MLATGNCTLKSEAAGLLGRFSEKAGGCGSFQLRAYV
jgi:hypothetical protein